MLNSKLTCFSQISRLYCIQNVLIKLDVASLQLVYFLFYFCTLFFSLFRFAHFKPHFCRITVLLLRMLQFIGIFLRAQIRHCSECRRHHSIQKERETHTRLRNQKIDEGVLLPMLLFSFFFIADDQMPVCYSHFRIEQFADDNNLLNMYEYFDGFRHLDLDLCFENLEHVFFRVFLRNITALKMI